MNHEGTGQKNSPRRDDTLSRLLVSVCCLSYNHGDYLREALDSFLMQEGDFDIEILVHDDASTDCSQEIIADYAARYPDIVKPLYQSENQYRKGISNPSGVFNFPRAQGRYIALCEGDDYWTDPMKLRKQIEFMDSHEDFSFCCHSAHVVFANEAFRTSDRIRPYTGTHELSPGEVISPRQNIPTASMFLRADCVRDLPPWYFDCPVGDVPLRLRLLTKGRAYYMDEDMSVYREGRAGSWGEMMDADGVQALGSSRWEEHFAAMEKLYDAFNRDTGFSYADAAAEALSRERFLIDLKEGRAEAVLDEKNALFLSELPRTEARLQHLKARAPGVYSFLRKAYRALK